MLRLPRHRERLTWINGKSGAGCHEKWLYGDRWKQQDSLRGRREVEALLKTLRFLVL